jgi:hypothetical protein
MNIPGSGSWWLMNTSKEAGMMLLALPAVFHSPPSPFFAWPAAFGFLSSRGGGGGSALREAQGAVSHAPLPRGLRA